MVQNLKTQKVKKTPENPLPLRGLLDLEELTASFRRILSLSTSPAGPDWAWLTRKHIFPEQKGSVKSLKRKAQERCILEILMERGVINLETRANPFSPDSNAALTRYYQLRDGDGLTALTLDQGAMQELLVPGAKPSKLTRAVIAEGAKKAKIQKSLEKEAAVVSGDLSQIPPEEVTAYSVENSELSKEEFQDSQSQASKKSSLNFGLYQEDKERLQSLQKRIPATKSCIVLAGLRILSNLTDVEFNNALLEVYSPNGNPQALNIRCTSDDIVSLGSLRKRTCATRINIIRAGLYVMTNLSDTELQHALTLEPPVETCSKVSLAEQLNPEVSNLARQEPPAPEVVPPAPVTFMVPDVGALEDGLAHICKTLRALGESEIYGRSQLEAQGATATQILQLLQATTTKLDAMQDLAQKTHSYMAMIYTELMGAKS